MASVTPVSMYLVAILCRHMYPKGNQVVIHFVGVHPGLVSGVEHAWAGWRNTVTDPEHMAAVELVREILSSDNEDWKTWAYFFATQQGDKPYTECSQSLTLWKRLLTRTSC
jgi:hypothetical protein